MISLNNVSRIPLELGLIPIYKKGNMNEWKNCQLP